MAVYSAIVSYKNYRCFRQKGMKDVCLQGFVSTKQLRIRRIDRCQVVSRDIIFPLSTNFLSICVHSCFLLALRAKITIRNTAQTLTLAVATGVRITAFMLALITSFFCVRTVEICHQFCEIQWLNTCRSQ